MEIVNLKPDINLASIPLFDSLSSDELVDLNSDASILIARKGELLFNEGDVGEFVFVVLHGSVEIFITTEDGQHVSLANLGHGEYFGEQALLPESSGLRTASAQALYSVRLLQIPKEKFQACLLQDKLFHKTFKDIGIEQLQFRLAQESALFRSISLGGGSGSWLTEKRFDVGDVIFEEGDTGDIFYLILMGNAVATKNIDGQNEIASFLGPGQYFGELALINRQPRLATITAKTELLTLAFSGEKFLSLYEDSPELQSQLENISSIYQLQTGGILTLHASSLLDMNSTTALFHDPSDVKLALTKVVGKQVCSITRISDLDYPRVTRIAYENVRKEIYREIQISDGKVIGTISHGFWSDMSYALSVILKGQKLEPWQLALFRYGGELRITCDMDKNNVLTEASESASAHDYIDSLILESTDTEDRRMDDLADVISIWRK